MTLEELYLQLKKPESKYHTCHVYIKKHLELWIGFTKIIELDQEGITQKEVYELAKREVRHVIPNRTPITEDASDMLTFQEPKTIYFYPDESRNHAFDTQGGVGIHVYYKEV